MANGAGVARIVKCDAHAFKYGAAATEARISKYTLITGDCIVLKCETS